MNTASATGTEQTARLSCRVNPHIKQRAEEAAALLGQSMTDFTEAALKEKAEAVLEQVHKIQLSERDFEQFVAAVNAPKPPTKELVIAMQEYERQRSQEPEGNW
ncbi:MAG: DUF1778 domain-containing protein [Armatimonadetes bacterium]|nr:DUF1778 domain-containing protein [Armatimonadota bacterium]